MAAAVPIVPVSQDAEVYIGKRFDWGGHRRPHSGTA